jgi:site-specific DNA-cytosine methylase
MGYKIAGYDVIGCNEIDPRMMKCYETNHHPQYSYLEDIRDLVKRNNLPEELYHLDILDGHHLAVHLACRDYVKMRGVKKRNSRKVKRHKF